MTKISSLLPDKTEKDNIQFALLLLLPAKTNPKNDLTKKDSEKIKSCVTSHNLVNIDLASVVHSAYYH